MHNKRAPTPGAQAPFAGAFSYLIKYYGGNQDGENYRDIWKQRL